MKNILLSPSLWGNRPPRGIPSERGEMAYRVKCGEHEEEMMEDPLDPLPEMDRERETGRLRYERWKQCSVFEPFEDNAA